MANLNQKVLETQKQNGHSVDGINAIVKSTIKKLNTQYRKGQNKKEIEDSYISDEYKAFISYVRNDKKEFKELLNECIIDETRISNYIKGNTKRPHNKTKDFFAVYCGCEGYNDFVIENKNSKITEHLVVTIDTYKSILQISGATIINEEFISNIENKNISKSKFYAGIQNDNTQFYGVLKGYDIERKHYKETKNTVHSCFEGLYDYPISSIVYGDGGSGKSVFLRKIAIDLAKDKTFNPTVLWLDGGNSIYELMSHGIETIKKQSNLKFLLILEDWYRMMGTVNENQLEKFLKDIDSIKNIRIIIGDRTIRESYLKYFAGTKKDAIFLDNQENENIIREIILDFPEWQKTVDKLFKDKKNYESTLFLLLFVIARTSQNYFENVNINPKEPLRTFINIIESDFNSIANEHIGLAKALHYWACIYAKHKIFISYETFLQIADFYNGNNEVSEFFIRWNIDDDEILNKLKLYINKDDNGLMQFNHDIFADLGLNEICLDGWKKFGSKVTSDLLDIITDKGDDYSASVFLGTMLYSEQQIFKDHQEQLSFVKKLVMKENKHWYYIHEFSQLELDNQTLEEFAPLFIDKKIGIYEGIFWDKYLYSDLSFLDYDGE